MDAVFQDGEQLMMLYYRQADLMLDGSIALLGVAVGIVALWKFVTWVLG